MKKSGVARKYVIMLQVIQQDWWMDWKTLRFFFLFAVRLESILERIWCTWERQGIECSWSNVGVTPKELLQEAKCPK